MSPHGWLLVPVWIAMLLTMRACIRRDMSGSEAANMAMRHQAFGGVYIAGCPPAPRPLRVSLRGPRPRCSPSVARKHTTTLTP